VSEIFKDCRKVGCWGEEHGRALRYGIKVLIQVSASVCEIAGGVEREFEVASNAASSSSVFSCCRSAIISGILTASGEMDASSESSKYK